MEIYKNVLKRAREGRGVGVAGVIALESYASKMFVKYLPIHHVSKDVFSFCKHRMSSGQMSR